VLRTVKAEIDEEGRIRPDEDVPLEPGTKVLITFLGDVPEAALLSERSLSADWSRPEEDAAWSHLSQA
jgi:hypothetical protein